MWILVNEILNSNEDLTPADYYKLTYGDNGPEMIAKPPD